MHYQNKGYSLIELIVILFFIAILSLSVIGLSANLLEKYHLYSLMKQVESIINTTRLKALSTNKNYILSPSSGIWTNGIELYQISINGAQYINKFKLNYPDITVQWNGFQGKDQLIFTPDLKSSALNGYFLFESKNYKYKLILNKFGRVRENVIND